MKKVKTSEHTPCACRVGLSMGQLLINVLKSSGSNAALAANGLMSPVAMFCQMDVFFVWHALTAISYCLIELCWPTC